MPLGFTALDPNTLPVIAITYNVQGSLTPALQRGCAADPDAWSPSLMFWRPRRASARRSANRLLEDVAGIQSLNSTTQSLDHPAALPAIGQSATPPPARAQ